MGPKTKELIQDLHKTILVLDKAKEAHWKTWMQEAVGLIESSDFRGVEKLLSSYGGMGSFNDLVLGGHINLFRNVVNSKEDIALNNELDILRERMHVLANEIKRDVESNT